MPQEDQDRSSAAAAAAAGSCLSISLISCARREGPEAILLGGGAAAELQNRGGRAGKGPFASCDYALCAPDRNFRNAGHFVDAAN